MSLWENFVLAMVKAKLNKALNLEDIKEISSDGIREHRDIAYKNRSGKELLMDILNP